MTGERTDPRRNAAFQRGFAERATPSRAPGSLASPEVPPAPDPASDAAGIAFPETGPPHNGRARSYMAWTVVLFAVGIGLCILSFALFSDFNGGRWGSIEATRSGDWVVTDTGRSEQRTVSQFEYLLYRYFSQSAVWIGVIGLAVVVGNLFRIAPRRPRP